MFEWEEDKELQEFRQELATSQSQGVFLHTSTRIPGRECLLVDTGAVKNLMGLALALRQGTDSSKHGLETQWAKLNKPARLGGIGDGVQVAEYQATLYGCLQTGRVIDYTAPVLTGEPGPPSETPGLYGLDSMKATNTFVDTRGCRLIQVPEGTADQIVWPEGTEFLQCEHAPSGHMVLPISHWEVHQQGKVQQSFPSLSPECVAAVQPQQPPQPRTQPQCPGCRNLRPPTHDSHSYVAGECGVPNKC